MPSISRRTAVSVTAGAILILAVAASPIGGEAFPLIALIGPIITGAIASLTRRPWRPVAAAWALAALLMLVIDWILNGEDQIFHVVLAVAMATLTALGAALARVTRNRRSATGAQGG